MRDLGVMNGGVLSDAVISPYPISMMTHVISLNPYIISIIFPIIWFVLNNLWGWSSCGGLLALGTVFISSTDLCYPLPMRLNVLVLCFADGWDGCRW